MLTNAFPAYFNDVNSRMFLYNIPKSIADNGVDMLVVCPFFKNSIRTKENYEGVEIRRFKYFFTKIQNLTELGSIPDAIKTIYGKIQLPFFCFFYLLKALVYVRKVDIIHAQWILPSGFIGVILKKIYHKPLVVTTRGSELAIAYNNRFWEIFLKYVIKNSDYITSNNVKHLEIIKSLIPNVNNISFIPNGLDYTMYKKRNKTFIRKKLHLKLDHKIILYVGHLFPVKNVDFLLRSFSKIHDKYTNSRLIIIGDGYLKDELVLLASNLAIVPFVSFLGNLEPKNVALYMNAADVLALVSKSEGRPNVVIEAMASGLPVITANVGDVSSFIENRKNGFIINPDSEDFLNKVSKIFNSRSNFISLNALKTVRKINPSWKEAGLAYYKLYLLLIEKNET